MLSPEPHNRLGGSRLVRKAWASCTTADPQNRVPQTQDGSSKNRLRRERGSRSESRALMGGTPCLRRKRSDN